MRRDLLGAARALVVPTVALLGVALIAPGRLALGVRIYALVLCAAAIVVLLLALRRAYPTESALRMPAQRARKRMPPSSLGRIEHEVALAVTGAFDLHFRLVPRLRAIAAGLLWSRRRIALAASSESASAVLGDATWELVRPDRPAPEDRLAKGLAPRELGSVVDALESV